jgi:hypothetical protein
MCPARFRTGGEHWNLYVMSLRKKKLDISNNDIREVSHQHENDNEHVIILWVRASKS